MFKKVILSVFFLWLLIVSVYAQVTRAIDTLPYSENFDTVTPPDLPTGWTVENTNNDEETWVCERISGTDPNQAMGCQYSEPTIAMDDWFFSPALLLSSGVAYRVTFSYRCDDRYYPEKLEVRYGSSPSSFSMGAETIYTNSNIINETFQQLTCIWVIPTKGEETQSYYYLGWHGMSDPFMWKLWIDDITIEEVPGDPVFNASIQNYSFGEQQISYNSTPQNVIISNLGGGNLYITSSTIFGTDASDFELVDDNTYTVTLDEATSMQIGIRFNPQTTGSKSAILRIVENLTINHDIPITGIGVDHTITTFPFSQNFSSGDLPANWVKISDGAGWRFGTYLGKGSFPIPDPPTPLTNSYAAVNKYTSTFEFDALPGRNDFLIPPPFDLTQEIGIPHLTFSSYYTMLNGEHATVEYSLDGSNWNQLYEIPAYSGGWKFIDVNLSAFISSSRFFVRFHADDMGIANATGWAIDDVNLLFVDPVPTPPTNIHISRTGTTVHISWDPVLYVSGYRVYSVPDPNSDLWTLETPEPITATSWSGNTSLPRKFFRIVSVR